MFYFSVLQTCLKRIRLDMPLTHDDYTSQDGNRPKHTDTGRVCAIRVTSAF